MASPDPTYEVIVVGAGIEGSSCAYNLAKAGKKVLLLEQFPLPHTRGSSHGQSRITRYAYPYDFYVRMMLDAFPMWAQLEKEAKKQLFINCGVIDVRDDEKSIEQVVSALSVYDVPHEVLNSKQVQQRFPAVTIKEGSKAVYDPCGGLLMADQALASFQKVFCEVGGTIVDSAPVKEIKPGNVVTVVTERGIYSAKNIVIATGTWTGPIASSLGVKLHLKPIKVLPMYWKVKDGLEKIHTSDKLPCFLMKSSGEFGVELYGLPSLEYPGLIKVAHHCGPGTYPQTRDQPYEDGAFIERDVTEVVKTVFTGLIPKPAIIEHCMYTMTPDSHPYIDKHPKYSNIIFCAGFSGHGFKLAPAVGKAVTELVLDKKLTYNMKNFKINRFETKSLL